MAEEQQISKPNPQQPPPPPPFVEVICKSSGKIRRFAAGTEAGYALTLINHKLDIGVPLAFHIEAVKEGEEPVSFGPNSVLVAYGNGWKLQTVMDVEGPRKGKGVRRATKQIPTVVGSDGSHPVEEVSQPVISFQYIGRIFLAFILIFVLGGILTLALENLPRLILFINSSM